MAGGDDSIWSYGGDQVEQGESGAFMVGAGIVALGLIFAILLAAFNSVYASLLVLSAVVFSGAGVLFGLQVMDQTFSIIMSGVGVLALAGIVVNNNIVLIDSWIEQRKDKGVIEAAEIAVITRARPVILTSVTTGIGLLPMLFGASISWSENSGENSLLTDLVSRGPEVWKITDFIVFGAPETTWWTPVATAIVFGLGFSTIITLVLTPAMLIIPQHLKNIINSLKKY